MKSNFYKLFGLIAGLVLPIAAANGQGLEAVFIQQLDEAITSVREWELKANILLILTILVGLLGASIAFLQKLGQNKSMNYAIATIGFFISVITIVINTLFPVDYRTLKQNAVKANTLIRQARPLLGHLQVQQDLANKKVLIEEITKIVRQLAQIEEQMAVASVSPQLIAPAFAGENEPNWVSVTPAPNRAVVRFTGVATSASLAEARERSHRDAIEKAALQMSSTEGVSSVQQFKPDLRSAREYVGKTAKVADTYFEYDSATNTYRYFTLLELSKAYVTASAASMISPSLSTRIVGKTQLPQFRHHVLDGEFAKKVAVYVGDVEADKHFRVIVFETGPKTASWGQFDVLTTSMVRAASPKILFDAKVVSTAESVKFSHGGRSYVLVFGVRQKTGPDRLDFEIYRS